MPKFSDHDLKQMDAAWLNAQPEKMVRDVLVRALADLRMARDRLNQNPGNSSRPSGSMPPWQRNAVTEALQRQDEEHSRSDDEQCGADAEPDKSSLADEPAAFGGAFAGIPTGLAKLFDFAPQVVQNMLQKLGQVISLDVSRIKSVGPQIPGELSGATQAGPVKALANEVRLADPGVPQIKGETRIVVKGKVVATTPKSVSLTLAEATSWYREQMNKLAGMVDKELSLQERIIQADKLLQILMNGATNALFDSTLASTLRESFARPSVAELAAEAGGAGQAQLEAILAKMTAPVTKPRFWFEAGACFVAGTLVHTKKGLVSIEALEVGDLVLSRPENPEDGTELAYKRVVRTFVYKDKEVMNAGYIATPEPENGTALFNLFCTLDHPFWVNGAGWTAASRLQGDWMGSSPLLTAKGEAMYAYPIRVFDKGEPGIGWMADAGFDGSGRLWDFSENKAIKNSYFDMHNWPWDDHGIAGGEGFVYKATVYNIEVEDYHTYFVGEQGIWVHNANCDVKLWRTRESADALLSTDKQPFASEAELLAFIRKSEIDVTGVAVVKSPGGAESGRSFG